VCVCVCGVCTHVYITLADMKDMFWAHLCKLWEIPIACHFCLPTCINLVPTDWIFMKVDSGEFYENLSRKSKFD